MLIPVLASRIKATPTSGPIGVEAVGYSALSNAFGDDVAGTGLFDPYRPVVSQGDRVDLAPGASATIGVRVDRSQLGKQTRAGWLVVALDDRAGRAEADRVKLTLPASGPYPVNQALPGR